MLEVWFLHELVQAMLFTENHLAHVLQIMPSGDSLHVKPGPCKTQKQKKSGAPAAGGALAGWLLLAAIAPAGCCWLDWAKPVVF
eukprot:6821338-Lingulodinium_polyedra.AAC.1